MFQVGQLIIYGSSGVCRVEEIGQIKNNPVAKPGREYYTLSPMFGSGKLCVPVDTGVFMRPVISKEQAIQLVEKIPEIQKEDCTIHDQRMLAEHYRTFFESHECEDLVQLMKTVYAKNQSLKAMGRKPGKTDLQYMKRAEDLLYGELAVALEIAIDQVPVYIEQTVEKQTANS